MNAQRAYGWIPVLLTAVGAIGCTSVVRADNADYEVPKQVVSFADLNVDSMAGASTLYRRIERAAERVCGGPLDIRELSAAARLNSCKQQAVERAVNSANLAVLTSLHMAKTGRSERPMTLATVSQ
jgi:UrcA family protein